MDSIKSLNLKKNELVYKIYSLNNKKNELKNNEIKLLQKEEFKSKIEYLLENGSLNGFISKKKTKVKSDEIEKIDLEIKDCENQIKEIKNKIISINQQNSISIYELSDLGNRNYKIVIQNGNTYFDYTFYELQWYITKDNQDILMSDQSKIIQLNQILNNI